MKLVLGLGRFQDRPLSLNKHVNQREDPVPSLKFLEQQKTYFCPLETLSPKVFSCRRKLNERQKLGNIVQFPAVLRPHLLSASKERIDQRNFGPPHQEQECCQGCELVRKRQTSNQSLLLHRVPKLSGMHRTVLILAAPERNSRQNPPNQFALVPQELAHVLDNRGRE